jgi:hypothetical protein
MAIQHQNFSSCQQLVSYFENRPHVKEAGFCEEASEDIVIGGMQTGKMGRGKNEEVGVDAKDRAKGGLTLLSPKRQRTWTESTNSIGSQTSIYIN